MYNSDGYIFIDMSEADFTKASQHITGLHDRIRSVIKANKLIIVINANNYAPMAATVKISGILMEIITDIYIFTINSNDILIIKENSGSFTEVTIVPALLDGVKIADYSVGDQVGSLYAPKQQSEINDSISSTTTTYSSDKIDDLVSDLGTTIKHRVFTNFNTASTGFSNITFDSDVIVIGAWSDVGDNWLVCFPFVVDSVIDYSTWTILSKKSPASSALQLTGATIHLMYIDKDFT